MKKNIMDAFLGKKVQKPLGTDKVTGEVREAKIITDHPINRA